MILSDFMDEETPNLEIGQDKKSKIIQMTNNGLDIFKHYIPDFKTEGTVFLSPLRAEKKPSANIFKATSGEYKYKDFASGDSLNCFDFVGELKREADFKTILDIIESDLKLSSNRLNIKISANATSNYWEQYIESESILNMYLEKYNIFHIDSFTTKNSKIIKGRANNPIFGFKVNQNYYKMYQPLNDTKFKHQWVGNKPIDFSNILGIEQLPESCETILITEGYKDCFVTNANLNSKGIYAIGLDNVSTRLNAEILKYLRSRCKDLILCLDIDKAGKEHTVSKSKEYGLKYLTLPNILEKNGGKDISDWFKFKLSTELLLNAIKEAKAAKCPIIEQVDSQKNPTLKKLLDTENALNISILGEIEKVPAIIEFDGLPIIKKGTINIIQGKFGSHKSRLAESFCSLLLSESAENDFVGFKKVSTDIQVCYIDTERNLKEELPKVLKSIQANAGNFNKSSFRKTSLKQIERKERLKALKLYLTNICHEKNRSTFVVLDVATDCITNFNDPEESLLLIDFIGNLCEDYDVTILMVVHENPNNTKARGHIGTEGANKASTVIGISVTNENLIEVRFIKQRATKRLTPIYLTFDEQLNKLVKADSERINARNIESTEKANVNLVADFLSEYMTEPKGYEQQQILQILKKEFDASSNTIKARLNKISEEYIEIYNERNEPCYLAINASPGSSTLYSLFRIDEIEEN